MAIDFIDNNGATQAYWVIIMVYPQKTSPFPAEVVRAPDGHTPGGDSKNQILDRVWYWYNSADLGEAANLIVTAFSTKQIMSGTGLLTVLGSNHIGTAMIWPIDTFWQSRNWLIATPEVTWYKQRPIFSSKDRPQCILC
jgi:hypothetical protein